MFRTIASLAALLAMLILFVLLVPGATNAQDAPRADYGDAPETGINSFPTRYNSTHVRLEGYHGAHHLDVSQEWLGGGTVGESVTTEIDANIPADDLDDGLGSDGIIVTLAAEAPTGPRYLNVLVDNNQDGVWRNEWFVENFEVVQTPGTTMEWVPELPANVSTVDRWLRITLTRSPIDATVYEDVGGWDGSAPPEGFAYGETEDYFFSSDTPDNTPTPTPSATPSYTPTPSPTSTATHDPNASETPPTPTSTATATITPEPIRDVDATPGPPLTEVTLEDRCNGLLRRLEAILQDAVTNGLTPAETADALAEEFSPPLTALQRSVLGLIAFGLYAATDQAPLNAEDLAEIMEWARRNCPPGNAGAIDEDDVGPEDPDNGTVRLTACDEFLVAIEELLVQLREENATRQQVIDALQDELDLIDPDDPRARILENIIFGLLFGQARLDQPLTDNDITRINEALENLCNLPVEFVESIRDPDDSQDADLPEATPAHDAVGATPPAEDTPSDAGTILFADPACTGFVSQEAGLLQQAVADGQTVQEALQNKQRDLQGIPPNTPEHAATQAMIAVLQGQGSGPLSNEIVGMMMEAALQAWPQCTVERLLANCQSQVNRSANLRGGPGTNFDVVGQANAGDVVEIVGQNATLDWFEIALPDGQAAWIAAFLVDVQCEE